ncbi:tRNA pseudouridine32 synthase / 23S rRNA pseudouridine746 synthase [Chitinophaga niastensis]|uniref:tRNA pseudouridine32 synthase / 23S rRNA pseudouridine746 synthase n=1 Tax=Chitinophaga niastensis TaxID=536980 RepID=A0A2P8HEN8_CHINA|nr:pseudouridylate synthase [Chitinophaga niastensis]PSL44696.1 tRNA pseudouridine32 synthase / 23S rRNA pseudouridine746 synthase [Chitinophaga niastensis]
MDSLVYEKSAFCPFDESTEINALAAGLTFSLDDAPHPLCILAASKLQLHLESQQEWKHNFGLSSGTEGVIIGKMFGVLIVRTKDGELGYLAAFSGKLAGGNHHAKFVPPIFDGLVAGGFVNAGMTKLTGINEEINSLESFNHEIHAEQIRLLKILRKTHSISLQNKIFEQYHFLNRAGESKSLIEIFENTVYKKPPAGAGECAAPKLLQYAFRHEMEPLALAEFWWGLSPKSAYWKHGHFYPPCREKCASILAHMLT